MIEGIIYRDVKDGMTGEIDRAVDAFKTDMAYTAPELWEARIEQLRQRLKDGAERVARGVLK